MPRLLLVDDNRSIHKIAETLLAASPIELVCVESAAAALEKVNAGEAFDVALVDISMAGMDGWGLLARLRELPATIQMPIAMMAGVLDTVDPERIKAAPIQGFLKKPVELRDLGERVLKLMETPVPLPEPPAPAPPPPASPYATMPATRLEDLPEFRKKQEPAVEEDDLLELTEEDLYPETLAVEAPEETLDLEELDLEGLQTLAPQGVPPDVLPETLEEVPAPPEPASQEWAWQDVSFDAGLAALEQPAPSAIEEVPEGPAPEIEEPAQVPATETVEEPPVPVEELEFPDLGAMAEPLMDMTSVADLPEIAASGFAEQVTSPETDLASLLGAAEDATPSEPVIMAADAPLDWMDESDSMLAALAVPAPVTPEPTPSEESSLLEVPAPDGGEAALIPTGLEEALPIRIEEVIPVPESEPPAAELAPEALPAQAPPAPVPAIGAKELLDALMADPGAMDALAKAVVARLGDQVLREIAWEVMPELAERLPRS